MIKSLLPLNTSDEQLALEQVGSKHLDFDLKNLTTIPKDTPVEILPYLAYMLDVDISSLEVSEQRLLIENALEIHRYKGTIRSVKLALQSIFSEANIIEWFEDEKITPYHYKADFTLQADPSKIYETSKFIKAKQLISLADNRKSLFDGFNLINPNGKGQINQSGGGISKVKFKNKLSTISSANINIGGGILWNI